MAPLTATIPRTTVGHWFRADPEGRMPDVESSMVHHFLVGFEGSHPCSDLVCSCLGGRSVKFYIKTKPNPVDHRFSTRGLAVSRFQAGLQNKPESKASVRLAGAQGRKPKPKPRHARLKPKPGQLRPLWPLPCLLPPHAGPGL